MDMEMRIKSQLAKSPEILLQEMKQQLENIGHLAQAFGPNAEIEPQDRGKYALATLKTIENLVMHALIGV